MGDRSKRRMRRPGRRSSCSRAECPNGCRGTAARACRTDRHQARSAPPASGPPYARQGRSWPPCGPRRAPGGTGAGGRLVGKGSGTRHSNCSSGAVCRVRCLRGPPGRHRMSFGVFAGTPGAVDIRGAGPSNSGSSAGHPARRGCGGIGRRARFRSLWPTRPWRFDSSHPQSFGPQSAPRQAQPNTRLFMMGSQERPWLPFPLRVAVCGRRKAMPGPSCPSPPPEAVTAVPSVRRYRVPLNSRTASIIATMLANGVRACTL